MAKWISHTNPNERWKCSLNDLRKSILKEHHIFSQIIPLQSGNEIQRQDETEWPLKLCMLDALGSVENYILREVIDWVKSFEAK